MRERVAEVLANPDIILDELRRRYASNTPDQERERIAPDLDDVKCQRDLLLDAYLDGTFDRATLGERSKALERRQKALEREFSSRSRVDEFDIVEVENTIEIALQRLAQLVTSSESEAFDLALRALDVRVRASRDEYHVEGVLQEWRR